jgi:carboxylate-amine ligase
VARTVGVEEEFLLVQAAGTLLSDQGPELAEALDARSDGQFEHELKREMAELATAPHTSLRALEDELQLRRRELAGAAEARRIRLAATATSPVDVHARTTRDPRYERMTDLFGRVARLQLTCGMHLHVAITSPDEGVAVADRLRPWLAVLIALTANSPFADGEDTGYASYRSILWGQWPSAGSTEAFGDLAGYEAARSALIRSGAALDDGMIYFDARLSARFPTLEVRVSDVCMQVEDAVTVAGLVRAMVTTAAADAQAGRPVASVRAELARAAAWRAAREGVDGQLVDTGAGTPVPAWDLVGALVQWVSPALAEAGDATRVTAGLATLRRRGTGARQQRELLAAAGTFEGLVDGVVARTGS